MTRPFSERCLACLVMMQMTGCSIEEIAFTLGRTRVEIDLAAWTVVGRSIPEAVAAINRPRLLERAA